jgi:hypothetical protein
MPSTAALGSASRLKGSARSSTDWWLLAWHRKPSLMLSNNPALTCCWQWRVALASKRDQTMPRNSSGTYSLPSGINPVVSNTLIETAWANPTMSDLGSALSDSLDRYGRGSMLAAMRLVDGTQTAPGLCFGSESTTGFYRAGAGAMNWTLLGVSRLLLTASLLTITPANWPSTPRQMVLLPRRWRCCCVRTATRNFLVG